MSILGLFQYWLGLLLLQSVMLPGNLPPLPEDPLLARVAPDAPLVYIAWNGRAEPDPKSSNRTEQLLAEPEYARLRDELGRSFAGFARQVIDRPELFAFLEETPKLLAALSRNPGVISLTDVNLDGPAPTIEGFVIVRAGAELDRLTESCQRLERVILAENEFPTPPAPPSDEWRVLPSEVPCAWRSFDDCLVLAFGNQTHRDLNRIFADGKETKPTPTWFAEIGARLPVARRASLCHLDVERLRGLVAALVDPNELSYDVTGLQDVTGLSNVRTIARVTGFDTDRMVTRCLVRTESDPQGWLGEVHTQGLDLADLRGVPDDASFVAAAAIDAKSILARLVATGDLDRNRDPGTTGLRLFEKTFDLQVQEDIVAALGSRAYAYATPSDGSLALTGAVFVVTVEDSETLRASLDRALQKIIARPNEFEAVYTKQRVHGALIETLGPTDSDVAISPSWALTDDEWIISAFPQGVLNHLARRAERSAGESTEPSRADRWRIQPEVLRLFRGRSPGAFTFVDTREAARWMYPLAQVGLNQSLAELRRRDVPIDLLLLPSARSILPHLTPRIGAVYRADVGVLHEAHGPWVLSDTGFVFGLWAGALMLDEVF